MLERAAARGPGREGQRRRRLRRPAGARRARTSRAPRTRVVFWDVDAPATLDRVHADPRRSVSARSSRATTWSSPTAAATRWPAPTRRWARATACPSTTRSIPTRTTRCRRTRASRACWAFSATACPTAKRGWRSSSCARRRSASGRFVLGGSGWGDKPLPPNVAYVGHVYTRDHNAFNCTPRAVLNISRESMARYGFSPATRVFEAAGRRRLHHHRRMGRHRAVSRAGRGGAGGARTARRWPRTWRR